MNKTSLAEIKSNAISAHGHQNNYRGGAAPYQALLDKKFYYHVGRMMRQAVDDMSSWFGQVFFHQPSPPKVSHKQIHKGLMETWRKHLVHWEKNNNADDIAHMFNNYIDKDLTAYQKQHLPRTTKDIYGVLIRHFHRNPGKLHQVVRQMPAVKKYYREDQRKAHEKKMQNFEEKFKRDFPRHKTYDETADYLKAFLKKMTPYEKMRQERFCKEVLGVLKAQVDGSVYRMSKYTTRVLELNALHKPSSYSYTKWSQAGLKKPTAKETSKSLLDTAAKHRAADLVRELGFTYEEKYLGPLTKEARAELEKTMLVLNPSQSEKDIVLVDKLYPAKVKQIFGGEKEGAEFMASLPVLDLGNDTGWTGYIDFIHPKHMVANIMRGVDSSDRPFVSFCYKGDGGTEVVETLFQRYGLEMYDNWASGTGNNPNQIFKNGYVGIAPKEIEWASRLVKSEPCGQRYGNGEEGDLTNDDGSSVYTLCNRK